MVATGAALWPSGRGVLAREDNSSVAALTNTVLSLTNALGQPVLTYYFRTHFTLTNDLEGISLVASNLIDDGAVVYLNGAEIYRINMPTGPITRTTLASAASLEGVFTITNFPSDKLIQGDNTLAVEASAAMMRHSRCMSCAVASAWPTGGRRSAH